MNHLIFFDSDCPFCHKSVRYIANLDHKKQFIFAPLNGETAKNVLSGPQTPLRHLNSLILVENYQSTMRNFWSRSRAIFRIYWLIGGIWAILGLLSLLPGWLGSDLLYRLFAAHRHQFKLKIPTDPIPKERLLP